MCYVSESPSKIEVCVCVLGERGSRKWKDFKCVPIIGSVGQRVEWVVGDRRHHVSHQSFQAQERGGRGSNDCPAVHVRLGEGWGRGGALQQSGFVLLTHISILLSEENTLNHPNPNPSDDNKREYLPVFKITASRKHKNNLGVLQVVKAHFNKHGFIWSFWICIL